MSGEGVYVVGCRQSFPPSHGFDIFRMRSIVVAVRSSAKRQIARVFTTGRSQAIRLPKEFRFDTETVMVHREGNAVILEPAREWPEDYVESFTGIPDDFERPAQGKVERQRKI